MAEEEKGFVIKDRRAFYGEGRVKEQEEPGREKYEKPSGGSGESSKEAGGGSTPLPEVNFTSLIFSLSSSALLHLGEMADPQSGKIALDLPLAKHAIDTIAMLKDKTKGNLNEEERKFTETVLTDLRWRYVRAAK
ncbi:MAG TPA: DUF1844 domain-containing protein [Desulfobacteraceae bacterium]|nr:DUF1844 domain-containing protein [Desulfobacteraceae bacterium]